MAIVEYSIVILRYTRSPMYSEIDKLLADWTTMWSLSSNESLVEGVTGARSIELLRGASRSIGHQQPSSRSHELVHHTEHQYAHENQDQSGDHLRERVQPAFRVLLRSPGWHALFRS